MVTKARPAFGTEPYRRSDREIRGLLPGRRYRHPSQPGRYAPQSWNTTGRSFCTILESSSTSQFVRRTQPCDAALPTCDGSGVPWMPKVSTLRSIQVEPTGLFGPALIVNFSFALTLLNLNS